MTESTSNADLASQETAARNATGWCQLTNWTVLEITGPDRQRFLHSFCTQDIKGMPANSVREAFVTNVKGRILGHLLVLNETDRLTLITVPGAAAGLLRHLQMYLLGLEAEIRDVSTERTASMLMGPHCSDGLLANTFSLPSELNTLQSQSASFGNITIAQVEMVNVPNWLLLTPSHAMDALQQELQGTGVTPVELNVIETLRIEAGFPWYGRDLSDDHIAQEAARTTKAISFTKGCYLGQEPIARLDAMGHTNRELRIVQISGQPVVSVGSEVRVDDVVIGTLTSVAKSATFGDTVALAVLRVKHAAPGTTVAVVGAAGSSASGQVCWPVVSR